MLHSAQGTDVRTGHCSKGFKMDEDCLGAVKIKDGLFIGDQYASRDLEFVVGNKVTRVVNCAGMEVDNHWEPIGVKYLTYQWSDDDSQVLLDSNDETFKTVYEFISASVSEGESILIVSLKAQGRACVLAAAYLMACFRWSSGKALEFLRFRQPTMRLQPSFVQQLHALERRMSRFCQCTRQWSEVTDREGEEMVVTNTYLNSQRQSGYTDYTVAERGEKNTLLKWADDGMEDKERLEDTVNNRLEGPIRSCIKGKGRTTLHTNNLINRVFKPIQDSAKSVPEPPGPKLVKKPPIRPISATKRENSPLLSRPSSARRESPCPSQPYVSIPVRKPTAGQRPSSSLVQRSSVTPQRQRGVGEGKGPGKVQSPASIKRAVWK